MDHGPVPVRTAVQPSLAGQGRPGRNAFSMHFPNESILTEKKRQRKAAFLWRFRLSKNIWEVSEGPQPL